MSKETTEKATVTTPKGAQAPSDDAKGTGAASVDNATTAATGATKPGAKAGATKPEELPEVVTFLSPYGDLCIIIKQRRDFTDGQGNPVTDPGLEAQFHDGIFRVIPAETYYEFREATLTGEAVVNRLRRNPRLGNTFVEFKPKPAGESATPGKLIARLRGMGEDELRVEARRLEVTIKPGDSKETMILALLSFYHADAETAKESK